MTKGILCYFLWCYLYV